MRAQSSSRILPAAAIGGAVLLFVGTALHPMAADPNVPLVAFAEYAADRHWVASHLIQLFGVLLMSAALVLLSRSLMGGPAEAWALLGGAGAAATLALGSALQAVDGVALKIMVDSWAKAAVPAKAVAFQAAFAVRQIEIGFAAMFSLLGGLTVAIYGIGLLIDRRFPRWIGIFALASGAPTAVAGVAIAYTGFSDLEMTINMPANTLLLLWMIALGVHGWRRPVSMTNMQGRSA